MRAEARLASALACAACLACGNATNAESESLAEPSPRDGDFDAALFFDGVDDFASVGTARFPQIERPQTLALWLAPASGGDELQVLLALRRSDYSGLVLALDRSVPVAYNVWGRRDLARATAALALERWQHLAYVLTGEGALLFVDGSEVAAGSQPATNRTPTAAFIGSLDGFTERYRGALDDVRLYDRAFSAEEVAALARGEAVRDAELLILHLPFDEAAGARSYDRSGLGNHAQLGDGVPAAMPERIPSGTPQSSSK